MVDPVTMYEVEIEAGEGGSVSPEGVQEVEEGEELEITAEPDEGWLLGQWEGDASGTDNPMTITVNDDMVITGMFERREYDMTIETVGEGAVNEQVVEAPAQIMDYEFETVVELTANPAEDWGFSEWQGDLEGNENPETVEVDDDKSITAVFREIRELDVEKQGLGEVLIEPEKEVYLEEDEITLTAEPEEEWEFEEWRGDLESEENPVTLELEQDMNITAVFEGGGVGDAWLEPESGPPGTPVVFIVEISEAYVDVVERVEAETDITQEHFDLVQESETRWERDGLTAPRAHDETPEVHTFTFRAFDEDGHIIGQGSATFTITDSDDAQMMDHSWDSDL